MLYLPFCNFNSVFIKTYQSEISRENCSTLELDKENITTGYEITAQTFLNNKSINLTDYRHPQCLELKYKIDYTEKISVIIVFYNEPVVLITRTIESFVS